MNFREAWKRKLLRVEAVGPGGRTVPLSAPRSRHYLTFVGGPVSTRVPVRITCERPPVGGRYVGLHYANHVRSLSRAAHAGARRILGWGYMRVSVQEPDKPEAVYEPEPADSGAAAELFARQDET